MQEMIHIDPAEVFSNRHDLTPGTLELVHAVAKGYNFEFQPEERMTEFYEMLGAIFHAGEISAKRVARNQTGR